MEKTPGPAARRPWALGVGAAVLVLLAYWRVQYAGFIWDDDAHVTTNPVIIGPLGLKEIWTSAKANYFPLTMTSFWLLHAIWGLSAAPYHIVTVLFHAGAAVLLWRILQRLNVPAPWLGAMLWALHPVQVESAAWISELKNTQSGFFFLLAVLLFLRWMQRPPAPRFRSDYAWALVAGIAAVLSKSSTVMLPVVLGLLGWWQGHRRWRAALWLAPFFVISLVASGWTIWEQKVNSMAAGPEWAHGLVPRLLIAGKVPWFYLGKLLWPELVFIYPRWDVHAYGFFDWLPLFALVAVALWLWRSRNGPCQPLFVGLGYFVISLFPVLGLFDVFYFRYSFVADHFQYLASMGPMVLIAAGLGTAAGSSGAATGLAWRAASIGVVAGLGILTGQRTGIYHDREALWRDTVARNPQAWIAQMNLGSEMMTTGRPAAAIPYFAAALALKPDDALAEANWGTSLLQSGQPAPAVDHLKKAVTLMPSLAEAHNSLGVALQLLGRPDEAVGPLQTAVQLRPDLAQAHANLAVALEAIGRPRDALRHLEELLRLNPHHPGAQEHANRLRGTAR